MPALSEFAQINPRLEVALEDQDPTSFLGMTDVSEDGTTTRGIDRPYSEVKKGYTPFSRGDLLVAKITPCFENGKIAQASISSDRGFGSTEFHVVRPDPTLADPRFVLHALRSPAVRAAGESRMTGSAGQRRVPREFLDSLQIPLPPLPEQRRIASILDGVEGLCAQRRGTIESLRSAIDSRYLALFEKYRGSRHAKKLADVATIKSGSTPDRSRQEFYGGGIPWTKTAEVRGELILKTEETVSELGKAAARLQLFPKGSIVVAMYGQGKTRGQSAVLGIESTVNQACAVILPSSSFATAFMAHQIRLSYDALRAKAQGGNQANLNLGLVGDLDVVVPDLSEQEAFGRLANVAERTIALQRHHLAKLDELFASLQHRAFRGEL